MDNQQALTEIEKAWLCGFFDGEGHVSMHVMSNYAAKKRSTNRQTIIVPRLILANTDYGSVMYWKRLWDKIPVGMHIFTAQKNHPKHKPCYKATIHGHKRCLKALPHLLTYSVTKKCQLEILAKWLNHRENNYFYTLKDYELYLEFMNNTNGKGPNDSTLRRLYESCTSELDYSAAIRKGWDSRRKVESGSHEKSVRV